MIAKKYIVSIIESNVIFQRLYIDYVLYRKKRMANNIYSKFKPEDVFSLKQIINEALIIKSNKNSQVAHVIGSGWSLLGSAKKIHQNDFVFGFNFSALSGIVSDIYLLEICSKNSYNLYMKQLNLINDIVVNSGAKIFFKNIWEDKNDIELVSQDIAGRFPIIKDILVPCVSEKMLPETLRYCLDYKGDYLPQYCSTSITCVLLAYYLGFKTIVTHGIDFYGEHFFDLIRDDISGDYLPIKASSRNSRNIIHKTASSRKGMRQSMPLLRDLLSERGVSLFAGSNESPSSEYLSVYEVAMGD